jgi:hypothetical protein
MRWLLQILTGTTDSGDQPRRSTSQNRPFVHGTTRTDSTHHLPSDVRRCSIKTSPQSDSRAPYATLQLPPGASTGLGHYVYALRDPRDGQVFYVGEGRGNRVFSHVRAVLAGKMAPEQDDDPLKVRKNKAEVIHSIHADGRAVEHLILRDRIKNKSDALMVEQSVIDAYVATGHPLTNLVAGHGASVHGLSRVEDAAARHAARPSPPFRPGTIVFHLNQSWYPDISDDKLYEITRGDWGVSTRSQERHQIALGVANDIIRSAYAVDYWEIAPSNPNKGRFVGHLDPKLQPYIGCHTRNVVTPSRRNFRLYLDGTG